MIFAVLLFKDFETLDVFGPVEIIGQLPQRYEMQFYSSEGGLVRSSQGVEVHTNPLDRLEREKDYILFLPGGRGTREKALDANYLRRIFSLAQGAESVLTVCTGSALLAATGFLKGKKATSNKKAFEWARSQDTEVLWQGKARWVRDGKVYTSSGVSAGMDMALAFIADREGVAAAEEISAYIEYSWNADPDDDPFALPDPQKLNRQ